MNGILDAAVQVDGILRQGGFRYCLIGGIALQRWGQPRTTLDVDVTVMSGFGQEAPIVDKLLRVLEPRIADAAQFALRSRVVLARIEDVGVDISLGALPFESAMMDRSSLWTIDPQRAVRTCSAADLIVQKVFAGRDQDWVDVQTIIARQSGRLDQRLILREVEPLLQLKEDHDAYGRLQAYLAEEGEQGTNEGTGKRDE